VQRGPFTFVHNLLHMTGERVVQPFVDDEVVAVYNGEIYNARQVPAGFRERHRYRSDGECLVPSYRHLGPRFPQVLDGEWALVLLDFAKQIAVLSTDVFSTKPLWYSLHRGFHVASYESALLALGLPPDSVHMMDPNQVLVLRLNGATAVPMTKHAVHEFDMRQFKTTTEDWQHAFQRAVRKRTAASNHPIFVGLSSGYDSGAVHLALESEASSHSVNYFTVGAEEHYNIIQSRLRAHNKSVSRAWHLHLSLSDFKSEKEWLAKFAEPFQYGQGNWAGGSVSEDGAAVGLSVIFRRCRRAGILVYLSGAGADEVISDYGFGGEKFFPHSSFGGEFPAELAALFPWRSVFLGTQRDYLMKEEIVAGSHGLEARYPFLDRATVQEFLWLSAEAKNAVYKRPVHDFLTAAAYPFDAGRKDGFAASRNLKLLGPTTLEVAFDAMASPEAPPPAAEDLSCTTGPELRSGPWAAARSRLATFLAVQEDDPDVVEGLGAQLLEMMGQGLRGAPSCPLGEVCMRILLLLLLEPGTRRKHLDGDSSLWETISLLPWGQVARSGWPLFRLLQRLSREVTGSAHAVLPIGGLVPLSGCNGRFQDENELDAPLAVLALSSDLSPIAASQREIVAFWGQQSLAAVVESARMCEVFAALERLSAPHYRVNLADAWHLEA